MTEPSDHHRKAISMPGSTVADGIRSMVPRGEMPAHVRKLRDTYALRPDAPLVQREFWFYSMDQFYEQGLDPNANVAEVFGYDPPGNYEIKHLGWCEASFYPAFDEQVLEDHGTYEIIRDTAGRRVKMFKNRRHGFMPEYLEHPVRDRRSWEEHVRWRMDPTVPGRFDYLEDLKPEAVAHARQGYMMSQHLIGGYMYLRSLFGPTELMYAFYDQPDLIHECMAAWLALADAVIAAHQDFITLDELYLAEDICFNHGPLCSPDTMKEFLFPYYQQLIASVRRRQLDPTRQLYIQVDTDGRVMPIISWYRDAIGLDAMSPFEVASGCDVVEIAAEHPSLRIFGGIDKRVLAQDKAAIDRMVDRILPVLRRRGGYIPHCDHSVPLEVSLDNYLHYRRRCLQLGN